MQSPDVTPQCEAHPSFVPGKGIVADLYVMTEAESDMWAESEVAALATMNQNIQRVLQAEGTASAEVCLADGQLVMIYRKQAA